MEQLLDVMQRFSFNGVTYDSVYTFDPAPRLRLLLEKLPPKSGFEFVQSGEKTALVPVSQDTSGMCVCVGDWRLYLLKGQKAYTKDELTAAERLHAGYLLAKLYWPKKEDLLEYWKKPQDTFNRSDLYKNKDLEKRCDFLIQLIRDHCPGVTNALELGCNIGRNLFALQNTLKLAVSGIDISAHAIAEQKKAYPDLLCSELHIGNLEDILASLPSEKFDLVYSMAVLMHLHPQTDASFWSNIPRVAKKYIITIENERTGSDRNWPRQYCEILGSRVVALATHKNIQGIIGLEGYTARVFAKV